MRRNQVWFADITYVPTWEGWLFLAVVMDACTKRIAGCSMRDGLKGDIALDALGMATIKKECAHRHTFKTRDQARFRVFRYIEGFWSPHRRALVTRELVTDGVGAGTKAGAASNRA